LSGIIHPAGEEFAGSETCAQCHQSISDSFRHTPHYLTSQPGGRETVKGSLDSGENVLVLSERLKVFMEESGGKIVQRASVAGEVIDTKPIDITIGSGRQGQTYLYWKGDSLFQLPASYHAATQSWSNSPGYPTDQVIFDRSITSRCLECHTTYFKVRRSFGAVETFDRSKALLSVDCERCHGPAARHVKYHRSNPDEDDPKYIINTGHLTRKQSIDNCALCHSGIRTNLMPSFTYVAGNDLDRFFIPMPPSDSGDVHGNQVGLLTSSKCFKMSDMTCSSCHNVHVKETRKLGLFSQRCMSCHEERSDKFCKQQPTPNLILKDNCIDCHMPSLPSSKVFLQSSASSRPTPFFVRTHYISTYANQVKIFLEKIERDSAAKNK
jgi:hypothetical protein